MHTPARTRSPRRAMLAAAMLACTAAPLSAAAHLHTPTMHQAQALVQQGDWGGAVKALRAIVGEHPANASAQFMLAYALHASGDLEKAVIEHKKAAQMPQVAAMANYNLGCAYALMGQTDDAFETLSKAIDMGVRDLNQFRHDGDLNALRKDERWGPMFDSIARLTEAETAMHFWVGEWDCYSTGTGVLAGTNTLAFRVGDKVVHESWASAGDEFAGESWNVYNRKTNTWEQTWVDSLGSRLFIAAKCNDDSVEGLMFEGENVIPGTGPVLTRMHVRPAEGGRVLQTGFVSRDDGQTWSQQYELIYVPKGEAYATSDE